MKIGLVQMRSGKDPKTNFETLKYLVDACAQDGAEYVQTPEMSNVLNRDRKALKSVIGTEENDPFVGNCAGLASSLGIYLHIGSLALHAGDLNGGEDGPDLVNRGLLFDPSGGLISRYDKVHMFDVDVDEDNRWHESSAYRAGETVPVVALGQGGCDEVTLGMAICYDMRFPGLARAQAQAGAGVLSFPSSFTKITGEAHWHALLRARAIENGAYVLAAAQGGHHEDGRQTFGHSLVYSPWGELVAELDHDEPGHLIVEIDPVEIAKARNRIPSLRNDRAFSITHHNSRS